MVAIRPYIFGIHGQRLTDYEKNQFQDAPPFGVILFLRNIDNPVQLDALIDEIKTVSNGQTLMFIDQEGGRVQRLAPPHWQQYPSVADYADLSDEDYERTIYAHHRLIGDELRAARFDVNFAPTLDLRSNETAIFLHDRTFGFDPDRVRIAGKAAFRGLHDAGIMGCMKHIPGHGRAKVDSHLQLPRVEFPSDPYGLPLPADVKIFQTDFGADMAMSAHILYTQIDADNPLTLSHRGIRYVREVIGFEGLMITDDLDMKALHGHQGDLAKRAVNAGIDIAMACSGHEHHIKEVYDADLEANSRVLGYHAQMMAFISRPTISLSRAERLEMRHLIGLA